MQERPSSRHLGENGEAGRLQFNDAGEGNLALRSSREIEAGDLRLELEAARGEKDVLDPGGTGESHGMGKLGGLGGLAVKARAYRDADQPRIQNRSLPFSALKRAPEEDSIRRS